MSVPPRVPVRSCVPWRPSGHAKHACLRAATCITLDGLPFCARRPQLPGALYPHSRAWREAGRRSRSCGPPCTPSALVYYLCLEGISIGGATWLSTLRSLACLRPCRPSGLLGPDVIRYVPDLLTCIRAPASGLASMVPAGRMCHCLRPLLSNGSGQASKGWVGSVGMRSPARQSRGGWAKWRRRCKSPEESEAQVASRAAATGAALALHAGKGVTAVRAAASLCRAGSGM